METEINVIDVENIKSPLKSRWFESWMPVLSRLRGDPVQEEEEGKGGGGGVKGWRVVRFNISKFR